MMNNETPPNQSDRPLSNDQVTEEENPLSPERCSGNTSQDDLLHTLQRLSSELKENLLSDLPPNQTRYERENNLISFHNTVDNQRKGDILTGNASLSAREVAASRISITKHDSEKLVVSPLDFVHKSQVKVCKEEDDNRIQKQSFINKTGPSLMSFHQSCGAEEEEDISIKELRYDSCMNSQNVCLDEDLSTFSSAALGTLQAALSSTSNEVTATSQPRNETQTYYNPMLLRSYSVEVPVKSNISPILESTCAEKLSRVDINQTELSPNLLRAVDNSSRSVPTQQKVHPEEVVLQPMKFLKHAIPPSEAALEEYSDAVPYATPPPSYLETIAAQPPPSYIKTPSPLLTPSPQKQAQVSIIRVNNSQTRDQMTRFSSSLSQSALLCHNSVDDLGDQNDKYTDYQLLALLACIMFWPIGLLAIYYANMASILWSEGIQRKAVRYSRRAFWLSLVSFVVGSAVYVIFYFRS